MITDTYIYACNGMACRWAKVKDIISIVRDASNESAFILQNECCECYRRQTQYTHTLSDDITASKQWKVINFINGFARAKWKEKCQSSSVFGMFLLLSEIVYVQMHQIRSHLFCISNFTVEEAALPLPFFFIYALCLFEWRKVRWAFTDPGTDK